jgi:FAD/FMN-containing dehydrogenase
LTTRQRLDPRSAQGTKLLEPRIHAALARELDQSEHARQQVTSSRDQATRYEIDEASLKLAVKRAIDPRCLMNPGKSLGLSQP